MGLGKTLTMISAILFSLDNANDFMVSTGRSVTHEGYAIPTKSTLVVVPSTRTYPHTLVTEGANMNRQELIDVWVSEIERLVTPELTRLWRLTAMQSRCSRFNERFYLPRTSERA
jgi:hypothetical protein